MQNVTRIGLVALLALLVGCGRNTRPDESPRNPDSAGHPAVYVPPEYDEVEEDTAAYEVPAGDEGSLAASSEDLPTVSPDAPPPVDAVDIQPGTEVDEGTDESVEPAEETTEDVAVETTAETTTETAAAGDSARQAIRSALEAVHTGLVDKNADPYFALLDLPQDRMEFEQETTLAVMEQGEFEEAMIEAYGPAGRARKSVLSKIKAGIDLGELEFVEGQDGTQMVSARFMNQKRTFGWAVKDGQWRIVSIDDGLDENQRERLLNEARNTRRTLERIRPKIGAEDTNAQAIWRELSMSNSRRRRR